MNLQDVRAAAEDTETLNYCITQDGEEFVKVPPHEMMKMRDYILAAIPPDCQAAITAEWLREVWGFEYPPTSGLKLRMYLNTKTGAGVMEMHLTDMIPCLHGYPIAQPITTRHQFTQLMSALNIQPRGITPKEGV